MSLKAEQRIIGKQITEFEPRIYSTGVHLVPLKVELNGGDGYIWVADEFNDDSYLEGKNVTPRILSKKINDMYEV